jgi:predicted nuclease of predicted toxin-antitoxin system
VPTYLVDENLPRSLAPSLRAAGFEAEDVRDQGLRGKPDTEVLNLAISRGWILVTGDLGFGSLIRKVSFPGVIGSVVTVEPKRLRIHQSPKP